MKLARILIMTALFGLVACTDATCSKIASYGNSASVRCYSGGVLIYEGRSTGKVKSEEHSDGYFFRDAADRKLKEVSGNCVIIYDD